MITSHQIVWYHMHDDSIYDDNDVDCIVIVIGGYKPVIPVRGDFLILVGTALLGGVGA